MNVRQKIPGGGPAQRALSQLMWLGLAMLACTAPLSADIVLPVPTTPQSDVTIKLSTPTTSLPRFGFAPVRVSIENAAAQERTWVVNFEVGMRNQYPGVSLTGRTITVPAGQTRDTWVFLPVAEPSVDAAKLGVGPATWSRISGGSGTRVTVNRTAAATRIMKVTPSSAGNFISEIEIVQATGVMTETRSTRSGPPVTIRTAPQPGRDVTYTIDPASGNVSTSFGGPSPAPGSAASTGGPSHVYINTLPASRMSGAAGGMAAGGSLSPSQPVVTVTNTPTGVTITRVTTIGRAGSLTQRQEIDAKTGVITTTTISPAGTSMAPFASPPARPGMEVTINVDPTTGNISSHGTSGPDPTAAPKITIVKAPITSGPSGVGGAVGGGGGGTSRPMPVAPPVVGPVNIYPTVINVDVSGPGVVGGRRVTLPDSSRGSPMRPFAVAASLDQSIRGQLSSVVRGAPNLSAVEVTQLPADWRVWSSFAGVILPADEYAALDAGRRGALRGWVGLGGRLWLSPSASGEERVEKYGAGLITTLAHPLSIIQINGEPWITKIQVYDGTPGLPEREALNLEKSLIGTSVQNPPGAGTPLAMFLLAFAIVVGPVNLFVFAPVSKRHRLFMTTPLIALIATLGLGVMILLQDGIGGDGMRRALVVLLPGNNEAAVFQEQAARTGFLTGRSFALADDTQMTVLPLEQYDLRSNFNLQASELARADGRASGDWFRNRSRQAQLVQRLVPTRGRVERVGTAPGGAPIVQSSLATPLRSFVCVDDHGGLWTVPELPPGKRVTLTRGGTWPAAGSLGGSPRFTDLFAAAAPNSPGRWGARGGATDLAPIATLSSVHWAEADVIFTGVLEGAAAGAKEAMP